MDTEKFLLGLESNIHQALKDWHQTDLASNPLARLHLFRQAQLENSDSRQAINKILLDGLETLATKDQEKAALLRRRFLDGIAMYQVANQLNLSEAQAYRKQKEAIQHLTTIIGAREAELRHQYQAKLEKRLRLPPEVQLFGIEAQLQALQERVVLPEAPWILSIEGLGGIGKTALANALLRWPGLAAYFHEVGWVTAKQQELLPGVGLEQTGAPTLSVEGLVDALLEQLDNTISLARSPQEKEAILGQRLKNAPHLIVVDNLETVTDYQALLPLLRRLANPGKFLLTSRHSLRAQPDVFSLNLAELNQAETYQFIRHEGRIRGLAMLADASEARLASIYEVVGGNPLALKLVIGQLSLLPLSQVLENLRQAPGQKIEELYTYIYWQAWEMLGQAARQTLLVMPLVQEGGLDQLQALSQLEKNELLPALQQLITLSLVQVGGGLEERRYTLHRLTETFLLNEAIQWKETST